jgi:hypothetical protein
MKRITRLLAMTGIGLAAGVAIAGPAQAATAGDGTKTSSSTSHAATKSPTFWHNDDDVVGYFNSPIRCERAGRLGEIRDRWDDYDCRRVRFGFHRGDWELSVTYWGHDHGSWGHDHDRGNGPWGHDIGFHRPGPFGGPFGGPHGPGGIGDHGPGMGDHGPGDGPHGPGDGPHGPGDGPHGPGDGPHLPGLGGPAGGGLQIMRLR